MTTHTAIDFRLIEAVGTVFLSTIEDELLYLTYGMTRLVKQGIETYSLRLDFLSGFSEPALFKIGSVDSLIARVAEAIEELQRRNFTVSELGTRVSSLEQSLGQSLVIKPESVEPALRSQATPTIAISEVRLHAIENSLNSVELLAGGLGQQDKDLLQMNQRLSKLEKLLQALSDLPNLLDQQQQGIARINARLKNLEAQQWVDREPKVRQMEPDRVF